MRTTLDLPENLIQKAFQSSGCKTKTALIKKALETLIQTENAKKLRQYEGKIDLDIDLDSLRKR